MTQRLLPALAVAAVLVACGGGSGSSRKSAPSPTASASPMAQAAAASGVVWMRARYAHGRVQTATGFVYDASRGWVLTANHAVEAAKTITVTQRDGRVVHGRLLARAQCHDFAVIALTPVPDGLHALRLGDSAALEPGQDVTAIAYAAPGPDPGQLPSQDTTYGHVTGTGLRATLHSLLPSMGPLVAHTAPLNDFASGSPLLDSRHRVVGLNTLVGYRHGAGTKPGLQYAMSASELRRMLNQLSSGPQNIPAGWRAEHRCHRAIDALAGVPFTREKLPAMKMKGGMTSDSHPDDMSNRKKPK